MFLVHCLSVVYIAPLLNNFLQAGLSTLIHPHSLHHFLISTCAALMLEENKIIIKKKEQTSHKKVKDTNNTTNVYTIPTSCAILPTMHTTKPFTHQLHPQPNKQPYSLQPASYPTTHSPFKHTNTALATDRPSTAHTTAFTRQPLPAMPSSYKSPQHTQLTPTCPPDSALILYSTACTHPTS